MLLIPTEKTFLRLVVALLFSVASLVVLLSISPYKRPEDTVLAGGCQLTLIFAFIGATYISLFNEFELETSTAVAQRAMVFSSTTVVAMPLIVITLAMAMAMLLVVMVIIRMQGRVQSICLTSTRMPPELTLESGQKWHLFLYASTYQNGHTLPTPCCA